MIQLHDPVTILEICGLKAPAIFMRSNTLCNMHYDKREVMLSRLLHISAARVLMAESVSQERGCALPEAKEIQ
ncbi:hypothetical protein TNCV_2792471 [Trichonephila clavipes]|nr:hypothetical protein TNCV_2792471 [Trichonephila clavipes]